MKLKRNQSNCFMFDMLVLVQLSALYSLLSCPLVVLLIQVLSRVAAAVRMEEPVFWAASVPALRSLLGGAASTTSASGNNTTAICCSVVCIYIQLLTGLAGSPAKQLVQTPSF